MYQGGACENAAYLSLSPAPGTSGAGKRIIPALLPRVGMEPGSADFRIRPGDRHSPSLCRQYCVRRKCGTGGEESFPDLFGRGCPKEKFLSDKTFDPSGAGRPGGAGSCVFLWGRLWAFARKRGDFPWCLPIPWSGFVDGKHPFIFGAFVSESHVCKAGFPMRLCGPVSALRPVPHRIGGRKMALFPLHMERQRGHPVSGWRRREGGGTSAGGIAGAIAPFFRRHKKRISGVFGRAGSALWYNRDMVSVL